MPILLAEGSTFGSTFGSQRPKVTVLAIFGYTQILFACLAVRASSQFLPKKLESHLCCLMRASKTWIMTGKKGWGNKTLPDDEPGPPKVNSLVVLAVGLHIAGYKFKRLSKRSQIKCFKSMYDTYPIVVQRLFDQLSGTLSDKKVKLDHVFWALFFLRKYWQTGNGETLGWSILAPTTAVWVQTQ